VTDVVKIDDSSIFGFVFKEIFFGIQLINVNVSLSLVNESVIDDSTVLKIETDILSNE
jgi:hypothetical protein